MKRLAELQRQFTGCVERYGPRLLPFADAATPELPLPRLLRLSLFQVSVGMAVVLLIGTLNRVMIVDLHVPASLVACMVSLPLVCAPFRALVGFRSDTHRSVLGWRRVPFLWFGTLLQFGGLCIMPFALLVLSTRPHGAAAVVGQAGAAMAFLLVGAGLHTVQTTGLALATDLAPPATQPRVVALLCMMLLLGMVASALLFGAVLANFTEIKLIRAVQGAALATMLLNLAALWRQEARDPARAAGARPAPRFREAWRKFREQTHAIRRLVVLALGTVAFSMQDVLLEPYGGQVLHLPVGATTGLTAGMALGGLGGFALAARTLGRGVDPYRFSAVGTCVGLAAFAAVICSAHLGSAPLFAGGVVLIGLGAGLFAHCTLTAAMAMAQPGQIGLTLGLWGAVQASAAGSAAALGSLIRDGTALLGAHGPLGRAFGTAAGYAVVYQIEALLLVLTLIAVAPLARPYLARGTLAGLRLGQVR